MLERHQKRSATNGLTCLVFKTSNKGKTRVFFYHHLMQRLKLTDKSGNLGAFICLLYFCCFSFTLHKKLKKSK